MQQKIGIITDSTCDIPEELIHKYEIEVLPLRILYKDAEYRDGIDITAQEVYDGLRKEVPSTSLPQPSEVESTLERMKAKGYTHVMAIHLSSALSGTSQMMEAMTDYVKGVHVKVIDSKSISMGLGVMVLEAARMVEQQKMNFDAICDSLQSVRERLSVYFVLNTLEYLIKGGRIGKVSGTLGQLLNIKPIIFVNSDGVYTTHSKVRGSKQAFEKMVNLAKDQLNQIKGQIAVCYGGAYDEAQVFIKRIEDLANIKELLTASVSPVIGVHTGPGTLGFALLTD